jgi:hypothetical protein
MGIRDFFKKQQPAVGGPVSVPASAPRPAGARPGSQPPGNPGVTKIDREHFTLHAPFQWLAEPGDNPLEFEFRNQTLREQLIVTVLLAREPFDAAGLQPLAEELANARLRALDTISNGQAVHSPLRLQSGSGQSEARCVGRDDPQKVRIAFVVRATPVKVVTVALTRYFLEEVGTPFEAYAGSIFDFLRIKNSGGSAPT